MSYIRSTSNPEGMYAFGGATCVEIYSGRGWRLSNIGPGQGGIIVPHETFYEACKRADYLGDEPIEVDGLRVEEMLIYTRSGRRVPPRKTLSLRMFSNRAAPTMFAVKLTYEDKYVFMYPVTWDYIRRSALETERMNRALEARRRRGPQSKRRRAK